MASTGSGVSVRGLLTKDTSKWQLKKYIRWQAQCKLRAGLEQVGGNTHSIFSPKGDDQGAIVSTPSIPPQ